MLLPGSDQKIVFFAENVLTGPSHAHYHRHVHPVPVHGLDQISRGGQAGFGVGEEGGEGGILGRQFGSAL